MARRRAFFGEPTGEPKPHLRQLWREDVQHRLENLNNPPVPRDFPPEHRANYVYDWRPQIYYDYTSQHAIITKPSRSFVEDGPWHRRQPALSDIPFRAPQRDLSDILLAQRRSCAWNQVYREHVSLFDVRHYPATLAPVAQNNVGLVYPAGGGHSAYATPSCTTTCHPTRAPTPQPVNEAENNEDDVLRFPCMYCGHLVSIPTPDSKSQNSSLQNGVPKVHSRCSWCRLPINIPLSVVHLQTRQQAPHGSSSIGSVGCLQFPSIVT